MGAAETSHVRHYKIEGMGMIMDHNELNIEDWSALSYEDDHSQMDKPEEILAEEIGCTVEQARRALDFAAAMHRDHVLQEAARMLWSCLTYMMSQQEGISTSKILGLVFALGGDSGDLGQNQTAAAKQYGVVRATVSAWVVRWRDHLGLPKLQHAKSDEARASYRRVQTENHWARRTAAQAYQQNNKEKV